MAQSITIIADNRAAAINALQSQIETAMDAVGAACEGYAKAACPVDTGRLRNSITHALSDGGKTVTVGTNVEYGQFVELGTSRMRPRPYLRPAAQNHVSDYVSIIKAALGG